MQLMNLDGVSLKKVDKYTVPNTTRQLLQIEQMSELEVMRKS